MSTNPRETQFAGFAKLLYEDFLRQAESDTLQETLVPDYADKWRMKTEQIIARRAYDLVEHVIQSRLQGIELLMRLDREWVAEQVQSIPDLTEWPED